MMDATSTSDNTPISSDTHSELWESSENEFKYLGECVCSESDKNIDGVSIMETNYDSEISFKNENCKELSLKIENGKELSLKNGNGSGHVLDKINDTCNEVLFGSIDVSFQPLSCTDSCVINAHENKDYHSPAKVIDPFDLSTEEEQSKEKYQPIKRKLQQMDDKLNLALSCSSRDENLSELSCILSCTKEASENDANQSSSKTTDPFDLSPDEELSQKSYQPVKRNVCNVNQNSTLNKNPVAGNGTEIYLHKGICVGEVSEAVQRNIPGTKRQRTSFRVAYIHSQELLEKTNKLIRIEGRAELVHSLINAFGLLRYLELTTPRFATDVEILGFHCPDYITFLRDISVSGDADDNSNPDCKEAENYGLSYDCPVQNGVYETCCLISGATIVAAESLISDTADVAINWYGGWHHAKRDSASGFCYINDIVLGILKLREKFDRILYVDIDLHHGDGVEEAFCMTPKVMTVSFHKYTSGFFPGSGSMEDVGTGKGKFYSVNVPLLDGIKDAEFFAVFCRVMQIVREQFQPQVVVMQCGADSLSLDPMASFNLTHFGVARCVGFMLSWNLPILLLGGGGYNFPNTAKCWTFLTSLAAGKKLPLDIPEHEQLLSYGPDFEISTTAGNRKDCNTKQYLANLVAKISCNLSNIKEA